MWGLSGSRFLLSWVGRVSNQKCYSYPQELPLLSRKRRGGDYFTTTDQTARRGFTAQGPCRGKLVSQRIEDASAPHNLGIGTLFRNEHRIVEAPACGTRRSLEIPDVAML
ncbi:hypothetical protein SLA2020_264810 [Shorea laevis]